MDDRRFDAFVRQLANGQSRRTLLKGLLGLGGVALAGTATAGTAGAARRTTPTPKPVGCPGIQAWNGTACDCPGSLTNCGPDCCNTTVPRGNPAHSECCDNACCFGECYGEERCCPTGQVVCSGNCCAQGEVCFQGECRQCTICGDDCCHGDTPKCCQNDQISICVAADVTCCTSDDDCSARNSCDGAVAHRFTCLGAVCTESVQDCNGVDPCSTYRCDTGFCLVDRDPNCCTSADQCQPIDSCTPASCLDNRTCNAVSSCGAGQTCCNGACVSADTHCCSRDEDCDALSTCDGLMLTVYSCERGACTPSQVDCGGTDPCTHYVCSAQGGGCLASTDASCCSSNNQCTAVDLCTPGLCLDNHTCNAVSACGTDEVCCESGLCSQGGSCG